MDLFYLDDLFKQEFLHISEPDLANVDGPPHSPCPSSASSSHIPYPELYPVRLQEVNLYKSFLVTNLINACAAIETGHDGVLAITETQQYACSVYDGRSSFCLSIYYVKGWYNVQIVGLYSTIYYSVR